MSVDPGIDVLLSGLRGLSEREASLALSLDLAASQSTWHEAAASLSNAADMARRHSEALASRLADLGGGACQYSQGGGSESASANEPGQAGLLQQAAADVGSVLVATAMVESLSHRLRDSWIVASSGTTAHITRQHIQDYLRLQGHLLSLMHDALLRDMAAVGLHCRCECAACSMGLCLCAATSRAIWAEGLNLARQALTPEGIPIPSPRPGSPADEAGFRAGDTLISVSGVMLASIADLQSTLKSRPADLPVDIRLRRDGREMVLRPQPSTRTPGEVAPSGDDCLQPSGQAFYLDRARDLQQQIRRGGAPVTRVEDGLDALSPRELQVLRLVADGATNAMIAAKLRIGRPTVARHVANILAKLGLANRTEAAVLAASRGLASDG